MKQFLLVFSMISLGCYAQNTVYFPENGTSPNADLNEIAWMEGHWKGEAFGGITEEIWSPPLGGSMMFVFKLVDKNEVVFYEIGHIRQVEETLVFELKHFHGDLKGWEEKDEVQSFKLVESKENRVSFDGFTFEKISADEINIYVVIEHDDKTTEEVKFNYKRQ
ncbi:hypothetical protein MNBD_BACTEROID03-2529 [hydrothermal vent metagenome]|uniref:DUF6265 domain-containing protein n=1 Tax=hydrothermal vent metagenome TaxID=652676 RepID=A0A3B0TIP8_9ZZZZ